MTTVAKPFAPRLWLQALYTVNPPVDPATVDPLARWLILGRVSVVVMSLTSALIGGMLAIKEDRGELRWLVQKPYNPYEPLRAALQSFPVLVQPGGELGFGAERENHVSARRTVIGQDKRGRILFIVAPQGYFTLHQLSVYLTESDLNLDIAVNLDGGGSTGILVANPREIIPPNRPLPFVILVYAR